MVAAAPDSNALRQLWPEVTTALRERSKVKWAMMNEVVIASVEGEVVNLLAPAGLARRIADESSRPSAGGPAVGGLGHWQLTISSAAPNGGPVNPANGGPANNPANGGPVNGDALRRRRIRPRASRP